MAREYQTVRYFVADAGNPPVQQHYRRSEADIAVSSVSVGIQFCSCPSFVNFVLTQRDSNRPINPANFIQLDSLEIVTE